MVDSSTYFAKLISLLHRCRRWALIVATTAIQLAEFFYNSTLLLKFKRKTLSSASNEFNHPAKETLLQSIMFYLVLVSDIRNFIDNLKL